MVLTTVLDLVGALLLIAALTLVIAGWSLPAAIACAGLGLLGLSWLIDRQPVRRRNR